MLYYVFITYCWGVMREGGNTLKEGWRVVGKCKGIRQQGPGVQSDTEKARAADCCENKGCAHSFLFFVRPWCLFLCCPVMGEDTAALLQIHNVVTDTQTLRSTSQQQANAPASTPSSSHTFIDYEVYKRHMFMYSVTM